MLHELFGELQLFYVVVGCETWNVYKDGSGGTVAHVWSFTVAAGV